MDYLGFGYVVDSCPENLTAQTAAASRLKCGVDKFGNSQYLCVPNFKKTAIVEYCYNDIVGLHKKGSCLVVNDDGIVDIVSCGSFTEGCTTDFFKSSDLYQYPACHQIDTEARCFSADPDCHKIDPEITRNISFVTDDTTSSEFSTTLNYTNSPKNIEYGQISAGAIAGITFGLLFVFIGILFIGYLYLRSRKKKRKQKETLASEREPFVLEENVHFGEIERNDEEKFMIQPEHNRVGISGNAKRDRTDELRNKINESNNEEEPLIPKERDVGLRKVEGTNTEGFPFKSKLSKEEKGGNRKTGSTNEVEDGLSTTEENLTDDKSSSDSDLIFEESMMNYFVGDYSVWKTRISDQFSTLTDDDVYVLYCFLWSDSGPPDFTDTEWLDMLNGIRRIVYHKENPVTSEEAQQTLDRLKSRDFLWEDQDKIKEDIKDEIMYKIASIDRRIPFYCSSYDTARVYLRSQRYSRKPEEKCVISGGIFGDECDSVLILRLQMNILTHVTMEDTFIYDDIYQILNVPKAILHGNHSERDKFLRDQKQEGEAVHYRGRSQDSVQHVTWLWRYYGYNRPDIVRSCIGFHPHNDIYIIDNKAYRKTSEYHKYTSDVRCLLYGLLLVDEYTLIINGDSHKKTLNKIRDRYFEKDAMSNDISKVNVPEGVIQKKDNTIMFTSHDIRHDVMYAFVTECLVRDNDLEFFLAIASGQVISEYCRSWEYERSEDERCLYVPEQPNMFDPVIDRLRLDIITHCPISDREIRDKIVSRCGVPREILEWDKEARKRYVEYAKRGTQTIHHARGMIVGCAGAGKTTLLKRLLQCSEEEIKNVESTEGLEIYEELFQICDETKTLKALTVNKDKEKEEHLNWSQNAKTLSFFDFGGQCAYYACHQIYLTRRAFYIVVVDASKRLDQRVDKAVCDQDGSVFHGWTYGDYFVFWLKSIHTYCSAENEGDQKPVVLIVATHWEHKNEQYKDKDAFIENLRMQLPRTSAHLPQYITEDNCYCVQFSVPVDQLESRIANIASHSRWVEKIPKEWAIFGIHLHQRKDEKIIRTSSIEISAPENDDILSENLDNETFRKQDILRFYHDAGKILHFNEAGMEDLAIIDVQWFVDAFKNIITDKLHLKGIAGTLEDWDDFYKTGNLRDRLLWNIWNDSKRTRVLHLKEAVLHFMQRLGLLAIGRESHYVPSMNRKDMDTETQNIILTSKSRSSVLVYRFDILPFFFFFRLVIACMQETGWDVIKSSGISYFYRNAAMFAFEQYNIVLSVTADSIQLQVLHVVSGQPLDEEKTHQIQDTVERLLTSIIGMFHKKLMFVRGIRCQVDQEKPFAMEIQGHFLEDKKIQLEDKRNQVCPLHRMKDLHFIDAIELKKYWKF